MSAPAGQAEVGRDQLAVLRRGIPLVLVTTAVVTVLAVGLSLREQSLYRSTAEVFVSAQPLDNAAVSALSFLSSDPERVLATQAKVARVPAVARQAVKGGGAEISPSELLGSSSVSANPDADVLSFSVTDGDAETARNLANAYANGFVVYRRQQDTGSLRQARSEINKRIADLRDAGASASDPTLGRLLEDSQTLRTRELLQGSNSTVGRPAEGAEKIQPRPVRDGFLGGVLGLALGVSLVFVRNALNTRVRSATEIEERLGIPLLGRVPPPSKRLAGARRLAVIEEPHSAQAEAYRMLATNIELLNLDRGAKSFMVASAIRGEGKSTTSASLAVTFARRGLHVVLLEADLRRPVLGKLLMLEDGPGLTDVVLGHAELDQALASTQLSDDQTVPTNGGGTAPGVLEVLEAGPAPSSPAELLKSQAFAQVVSRLSERGDILIIDTPPLLHVSDAMTMMLSAKIDCAIVATRIGVVRRQAIDEIKRTLDTTPVVKLGFFATGEQAHEEYTGGYGYYYSRGRAPGLRELPSAKGRSRAES
ncbi:MAG: polysaccharide biosynthesis tyrosine autokinase [Actinomycetota bacterium]